MIFSELYSAYYNTVAGILSACLEGKPSEKELRKIVEERAFSESVLTVLPALKEERWQLLRKDLSTPIRHAPTLPLTLMEKRWLKAILKDPRVRLFDIQIDGLEDVEPLFDLDDICYYDRYTDGDPYEDEGYIQRFRLVLEAIREGKPLQAELLNRKKKRAWMRFIPTGLEYSEKDDKFRIRVTGSKFANMRLGRIYKLDYYTGDGPWHHEPEPEKIGEVVLELHDVRNALDRVMNHFAHLEKEAEKIGQDLYRIRLRYYQSDETELVIRILGFGPVVKVLEPESFVEQIRDRLRRQMECGIR